MSACINLNHGHSLHGLLSTIGPPVRNMINLMGERLCQVAAEARAYIEKATAITEM